MTTTTQPQAQASLRRLGVPLYQQIFAPGSFEPHLQIVEALRPLAQRKGLSLAQLALAWVLHQEGITAAIVGARSAAHATEAASAGAIALSTQDLADIEAACAGAHLERHMDAK